MNDFYVGYLSKAPTELAKFVRRVVTLTLTAVAILSAILVVAQQRFSPAVFEWQNERDFRGIIEEHPYPTLLMERPGQASSNRYPRYLLVGLGKHGAEQDVRGLDGKLVQLRGKLIYRAENTMIEVMPNSIVVQSTAGLTGFVEEKGIATVRGEIVDSKCFSGVMNPGNGKVHRDCATRCLSGGVPPLLLESEPPNRLILLTGSAGEPLSRSIFLDKVAEPIVARGHLIARGNRLELQVENLQRER